MSRVSYFLLTFVLVILIFGDGCQQSNESSLLKDLETRHATKRMIAEKFGEKYTYSEKGQDSWTSLEAFLKREPSDKLKCVRSRLASCKAVMFYTDEWRMIWFFLGENDNMQSYCVSVQ